GLTRAGLARSRQEGRFVIYSASFQRISVRGAQRSTARRHGPELRGTPVAAQKRVKFRALAISE
ncbi:MAG: hypothetical protein O3A91_07660, partial [Proteobacteria bacterium]|nr:hypothetical protein [Pseudomonadota bacterium]